MESWVEACPCHQFLKPMRSPSRGSKPVFSDACQRLEAGRIACGLTHGKTTDGPTFSCPMRGKRAVEVASGAIAEYMAQRRQTAASDLLCRLPESLTSDEIVSIVDDFNFGVAHMDAQASLKLRHWSLLPWSLAGSGHWNEDIARKCVEKCLKLFDAVEPNPALHHRVTWYWLRPGSQARTELEAFVNGAPRDSLPLLSKLAAEVMFMPLVERCQEGQHSLVNRQVGDRKVTGPYVSLAIRSREIERCSCGDTDGDEWIFETYRVSIC